MIYQLSTAKQGQTVHKIATNKRNSQTENRGVTRQTKNVLLQITEILFLLVATFFFVEA